MAGDRLRASSVVMARASISGMIPAAPFGLDGGPAIVEGHHQQHGIRAADIEAVRVEGVARDPVLSRAAARQVRDQLDGHRAAQRPGGPLELLAQAGLVAVGKAVEVPEEHAPGGS